MTDEIALDDRDLMKINGAIGASTVIDMIASAIDAVTPTSLIPNPTYTAWSFGPNAGAGSIGNGCTAFTEPSLVPLPA